ncbi:MAG: phosphatidate cytidylyltransferase [Verrucomicrobiales bacterium]|nr:phosphatidate cytidylyltransferase [Verrucomicrobiales bacterium]
MMVLILGGSLGLGFHANVVIFGLISFLALREFVTATPTSLSDHRALFWMFFVILPFQYWLVWRQWYGLFATFIPIYAFIFIPLRLTLAGDHRQFLERSARMQWAMMVCVYFVSHLPMLLSLKVPGFEGLSSQLLLFLIVVVQSSDVLQYVWGKLTGRHRVAPVLSPSKTWEGLIGGVLSASLLGSLLAWMTPFTSGQAFAISFLVALLGFFGGLVLSAIKRDRGIKDWGQLIEGHGGMLDRIDSLCFSAPLFFHIVRYLWT